MTKRELLENYRSIVREIETLEKQSVFLNQYIGGPRPVKAVHLTGMPRGTNEPEAAMMQRADYDDAVYVIEQKMRQLCELVQDFEKIMDSIPDRWDMVILRDYYALGWTDKKIASEIGFDKSTVWRRRTRAINSIDDDDNNNSYSCIFTKHI